MGKAALRAVNYEKGEITQGLDENPALFLPRLAEATQKYTSLDPDSREVRVYLHLHFTSQSAPDIRKKPQKPEGGPQTPQRDIIKLAFKVSNSREEEEKA